MHIYPEKNEQLGLLPEERVFLRAIERGFLEEEFAYYVPHVNPRKKELIEGKPELFHLFLFDLGIVLFRFLGIPAAVVPKALDMLCSKPEFYDVVRSDLQKRLEESCYLTDAEGKLRFALQICYVVPNADSAVVLQQLKGGRQEFCRQHVIFQDTIKKISQEGRAALDPYMGREEKLREEDVNHVFQRFCPEITIPQKYISDDKTDTVLKDGTLNAQDRAVRAYRLDDWQINTINRIAKGNQLILACAGSGKSVLLVSRCFKLAALNPCERFLITCYNKNLADYYNWTIAQAGFTDRNVRCSTFYSLCTELLRSNGIPLPRSGKDSAYFDELFERAQRGLAQWRIKERFFGIFIDEIQIFKTEWYRFCFQLLVNKNADDHFFVISGDKAQDIKNNIKHGKAPWQGSGREYPEYRGKTLSIQRNYRNSKPISDAIDRYIAVAQEQGRALGLDVAADPEAFLHGEAYRPGNPPSIVELTEFSNAGETAAIASAVRRLIEERNLRETDIAVLLFNKKGSYTKHGWKDRYYNLEAGIRSHFAEEGWETPAFLYRGKSDGATYGARRGVTVVSIEGALGLDFRGVVLAGLRPLGAHDKAGCLSEFQEASPEELPQKLEAYQKCVNLLYTACTRAKDELTVILSAPEGASVYMDLLRRSLRG